MAKELPYFKFYIGDWANGDITLEDYKTQGVFINICAYYWSKDCVLELEILIKKFRGFEGIIENLINLKIIKLNQNFVVINFLNEQLESKEVQKSVNKKNGKLGGRPIGKKTEKKPNGLLIVNRNETETKAKNNRNITNIDKRIVDNTTYLVEAENFDLLFSHFKESRNYRVLSETHKLNIETIENYFKRFFDEKIDIGELKNKKSGEAIKHFSMWLPKIIEIDRKAATGSRLNVVDQSNNTQLFG